MKKMFMSKKMIGLNSIALICVFVLGGFMYMNYQNNITINSIINGNSSVAHSGITDELITKNYTNRIHSLNLTNKNLLLMPDICNMVKGTKYVDDIWSLDLSDNGFAIIDKDLSCLKNLSELNLSFNKISKIENLERLTFLKKLDLGNNEIETISGLDKLANLVDLHLGYNSINNTDGLGSLKNLKSLKLQNNKITDLSGISGLKGLIELKMEFNQLNDSNLEQIPYIDNLKIITVAENKINKSLVEKYNAVSLKNM